MLFRSFILRLSQILAVTATICIILMAATLFLQQMRELAGMYLIAALPPALWIVLSVYFIRKYDSELVVEVARIVYPVGGLLSLALSILLAIMLGILLPGSGYQPVVLVFAGAGVLVFLLIRSLDIRWLRTMEEIESLNRKGPRS
jgi:hypothetical protein